MEAPPSSTSRRGARLRSGKRCAVACARHGNVEAERPEGPSVTTTEAPSLARDRNDQRNNRWRRSLETHAKVATTLAPAGRRQASKCMDGQKAGGTKPGGRRQVCLHTRAGGAGGKRRPVSDSKALPKGAAGSE